MGGRGVVVLGVVAVVTVFVLPPVGLALGILTIVFAARLMRATKAQPQELLTPEGAPIVVKVPQPGRANAVFSLVLGITATTLGALLLIVLIAFWPQVRDYSNCHDGVNTNQGEQDCKNQLKDAILHRVGD